MSSFGELLYQIIQSHGISVSKLAQVSGVERTSLHKFISGERAPKKSQAEALLNAIALTPQELANLKQAFEIRQIGEAKYVQRKRVQKIIEDIANVFCTDFSNDTSGYKTIYNADNPPKQQRSNIHEETKCISGEFEINNAISAMIMMESDQLYFSIPHNYSHFYNLLFTRYSSTASLSINCFISFIRSKNTTENLDILTALIPFLMSSKDAFHVNYAYSDMLKEDLFAVPFPFFLLTTHYCLMLTGDLDRAIMTNNSVIRKCGYETCKGLTNGSDELTKKIKTTDELLKYYSKNLLTNPNTASDKKLSGIESQPCLLMYLDLPLLRKYAIDSHRAKSSDTMFQNFSAYTKQVRKATLGQTSVFTKEGLGSFVESGVLSVIPSGFLMPFGKSDRSKLLSSMLQDTVNNTVQFRLLDPTKLSVPPGFSTGSYNNHSLLLADLRYTAGTAKVINIEEPSIVDAFSDFFNSIPDSDLVLTKEETIQAIKEALDSL